MIEPEVLADLLVKRGVVLNLPPKNDVLEKISIQFPAVFGGNLVDIYRVFDGFAEDASDRASQISIWSMQKILRHELNDVATSRHQQGVIIGDFLIESDFINVVENEGVFMFYEKRKLASSAQEFFDELATGRYDFL